MKKVLILGNAQDRKNQLNFIKSWKGDIFVCNKAYTEFQELPTLTAVASVHDYMAVEALDFKKKNNLPYRVICSKPVEDAETFLKFVGFSTGIELIRQAILEKYDEIWIAGFEFIKGEDIYQAERLYCGNFEKQYIMTLREYPEANIYWVPLDDPECNLRKEPIRRISQEEKIFKKSTETNQSLLEKFKNFTKQKNDIVVVGNSPSILGKGLGKTIDSFSYVVRINDYVIDGFEADIGSKTTFWTTGASFSTKIKGRNVDGVIPLVFLPPARFEKEARPSVTIERNLEISLDRLCLIDREDIKAIHQYANIPYLSTGLMTIIYFAFILRMDVTIVGFKEYNPAKAHYYDADRPYISPLHDFPKEFEFIDNLVTSNKIKKLD